MRWIFFILFLMSCQKSSSSSSSQTQSSQNAASDLSLFPDAVPLDGTQLSFTNLKASATKLGPVNLMQIDLTEDPLADFYQFSVCMADGSSCLPDKNTPGEFVYSPLVYPYAPPGNVVVSVRGCLRKYNAISPDKTCTNWQSVSFVQTANTDSPVLKYLKQLYDIQVDVQKKSEMIYFLYQNQSASNPDMTIQNDVKNMLHVGQDTLGQLLMSDVFLNSYMKEASGNAQTGLFLAGDNNVNNNANNVNNNNVNPQKNTQNPHLGYETVNNIPQAANSLSQPTELQNALSQNNLTGQLPGQPLPGQVPPPPIPPSTKGLVVIGQMLSKKLSPEQKKELNSKLEKIEMYQNLKRYLGVEDPNERANRITEAQALYKEGKLSAAGLQQAEAPPLGSSEDLRNVIVENPNVVIGKAQVHVELLDAAARELTGGDLANWNEYQRLSRLQPLKDPKLITKYNNLKTKFQAMNILDEKGNVIPPPPDSKAVMSSEGNRPIAEVSLDPPKTPVPPVEPVHPVVEPVHPFIDPTIPKPPPPPPAKTTPRGRIPLAAGTTVMSEEDFKTAVDQIYQTIVQDRLDFSNIEILLAGALKGM